MADEDKDPPQPPKPLERPVKDYGKFFGYWKHFNQPTLIMPATRANDIEIQGPIISEREKGWFLWLYETEYYTTDVEFKAALDAISGNEIRLNINSPGGTAFVSSAIRSYILEAQANGKTFEAFVRGMAASAATEICATCDTTVMVDSAIYMIHRAGIPYDWYGYGNVDDLRLVRAEADASIQYLKQLDLGLLTVYAAKTGLTEDQIKAMIKAETYMNAETAKEKGFVDSIQTAGYQLPEEQQNALPPGLRYAPAAGLYLPKRPADFTPEPKEPEPPEPTVTKPEPPTPKHTKMPTLKKRG